MAAASCRCTARWDAYRGAGHAERAACPTARPTCRAAPVASRLRETVLRPSASCDTEAATSEGFLGRLLGGALRVPPYLRAGIRAAGGHQARRAGGLPRSNSRPAPGRCRIAGTLRAAPMKFILSQLAYLTTDREA